ncbi:MAG TPA: portal protein, partial [Candidatus Acidoferrales bacterium]|nr:portal protein [Candidatus Acidoferrales bacterium]
MADAAEKLTSSQTQKVLERARSRLKYAEEKDRNNRRQQRVDTEFVYVAGKQWDDGTRAKRTSWGEVCLEFPQLKQFVNQVVNDQRQNRPGIRIHPASGDASREVADILQGMIRGIEYDSRAESVYDCGYQCSVVGGRGYWRVTAEYERPDGFDQKLVLKRIPDPLAVYLDPDYQDPDGGDRNWGYVLEQVHKDDFAQRWPDAEPLDFSTGDAMWYPDDEHVMVADYYERVATMRELLALRNGTIGYRDDLEKVLKQAGGMLDDSMILRTRKTETYRIDWYTVAGGDQILETHDWPGTIIPIVCTMGDEIMVDGDRIYQGLVAQAKSSQAMFNYGMTNQAVGLALTPRAPWVAEFRQVEGFDDIWNSANERNWSVLPYNAVTEEGALLPAPQRQPAAEPSAGWINWTQQMTMLMKSTIGMYENSLGM